MTEPLLNVKMDVNLPYDTDWESLPDFMKYACQTINDEQNVAKEGDVVTVELYYAYPKDGGEPFIMWSDVNGISTDGEDGWDPYSAAHSEAEKAIPGVFASQRAETLPRTPLNHSATSRIS